MTKYFFDSKTMLRFDEKKVAKVKFYGEKNPIKIWEVNVNNIVISKLVEPKNNFKHLLGYLDIVIRPLVSILPKMSGYVKIFKVKDGDREKKQ